MDKIKVKLKALETIDDIYDQVEKLNRRKDSLSASLKDNYKSQLKVLEMRRKELKEKVDELEHATEENWQDVKESLAVSLDHYKAGFKELSRIFK